MNTWVWHQVGLELSYINIEGTIEAKRRSEGGNHLTNKAVEIGVGRSLNIKRSPAHVVEGLIIETEGAVGVLKKRVRGKHMVVWLNNGSGDLRSRSHSERQLRFATVVDGKSLQKEGAEAGSSSTSSGMEDKEALETGTIVGKLSDAVKAEVNNLLADGVMTTSIVVGSVFLARNKLLRVVKLPVSASSHLIERSRLKIKVNGTRNVFTGTSFREKGVERVITTAYGLVRGHLSIRLDPVLKTVKLPAAVAHLVTGLTEVKGKNFSHV
jgi:hypothetical protein